MAPVGPTHAQEARVRTNTVHAPRAWISLCGICRSIVHQYIRVFQMVGLAWHKSGKTDRMRRNPIYRKPDPAMKVSVDEMLSINY